MRKAAFRGCSVYSRQRAEGSKRFGTTFLLSRLLWLQIFIRRFFITIIDCIGDFYYYINVSYLVIPYVGILATMVRVVSIIVISLQTFAFVCCFVVLQLYTVFLNSASSPLVQLVMARVTSTGTVGSKLPPMSAGHGYGFVPVQILSILTLVCTCVVRLFFVFFPRTH